MLTGPVLDTISAWLAPLRAALPAELSPADSASFQDALNKEGLRRFEAFLNGLRAYQANAAVRRDSQEVAVLCTQGTTRLLDYAPGSAAPVLFIIPSLVNRFEILDLAPERSFLRYLATQGLRPLVVDWQEPGDEEKNWSLSDYMAKRLIPLLATACAAQDGKPCHILGYCMGGVLALALAQLAPAQSRSLTLMATPWDFSPGVGGVPPVQSPMGRFFLRQADYVTASMDSLGLLPAAFLQAMFTAFQPVQIIEKFARFTTLADGDERAARFVLTEDWLNDGVPLAQRVATECLHDWYRDNLTAKGAWSVAGQIIDPTKLHLPTYVLAASKDRIVPPESTKPLTQLIRGALLHEPAMGHIGLMTGDVAPQEVWQPLAAWLRAVPSKAP